LLEEDGGVLEYEETEGIVETVEESENNLLKNQYLHQRTRYSKSLSPHVDEEYYIDNNTLSDHY
jgi:hypothetical protein